MRTWVRPTAISQQFIANDYVSACQMSFSCNAIRRELGPVVCNGLRDIFGNGDNEVYNSYKEKGYWVVGRPNGCGKTEVISQDTVLYKGWADVNENCENDDGDREVYIWIDKDANDGVIGVHCTTNTDISTWEPTKS